MIHIGTVTNNETKKNRDSDENQRVLACEITSSDDVQSIELSNTSGEDTNPLAGDTVLVIPIEDAYKMGILIDDGIAPEDDLDKGEKELYSRSDEVTKAATLRFRKNGELVLNKGIDYAVKFNELKTAFNQLQNDFDVHIHPEGSPNTGAPTNPSSADIDPAKVEKVRL